MQGGIETCRRHAIDGKAGNRKAYLLLVLATYVCIEMNF